MNPLIQIKTITSPILITLTLLCFGLFAKVQAVVPPPDGGYPGANTAEGNNALFSLTSGMWNTAVGAGTLNHDTTGGANTATGFQATAITRSFITPVAPRTRLSVSVQCRSTLIAVTMRLSVSLRSGCPISAVATPL